MPVSVTYIAVVILLLILIGFVLTVVKTLSNVASSTIRHDMNRLLSSYDYLINSKTEEIHKLDENIKKKQINIAENKKNIKIKNSEDIYNKKYISPATFVKNEVRHRDSSLADGYDSIKTAFSDYKDDMKDNLKIIQSRLHSTRESDPINRLASLVTNDVVYELSLRSNEEQYEFFDKTLKDEDKKVLIKYLELNRNKEFNIIEFYDWLRIKALELNEKFVIRSGIENEKQTNYDPSICEGYQIVVGDKLYDYSISKRDIQ